MAGVEDVEIHGLPDGWVRMHVRHSSREDLRETLFRMSVQRGWKLRELRSEDRSLEDVFAELTEAKEGRF